AVTTNRFDWDFVLLKTGVAILWLATFAGFYRAAHAERRAGLWATTIACLVPIVGYSAAHVLPDRAIRSFGDREFDARRVLSRYLVYNPSFRVVDGLLHDSGGDTPTFNRFLRSNTNLGDIDIPSPENLDLVPGLTPSHLRQRPFIFLFVLDSLRPDYLAPYNPAVAFTPRFKEFGAESLVLRNAFTRYGGTGLSVPAIWSGFAGLHKQYVQPFHPMNSLEKLLHANGYRMYLSLDSIIRQLLLPSPSIVELD